MFKFVHLFKKYYLGISFIGIIAFVIQEIPYIIMPLIKPISNPIMNMQNVSVLISLFFLIPF